MVHVITLRQYPVILGPLADTLPNWLHQRGYTQCFLIADEHTAPLAPDWLMRLASHRYILPAGEQHKTLEQCEQVWDAMLGAGLDRRAVVLNFGGGVIGDLGGFCAATWKRGIDFLQLPTTLLAMTDAAIGGKLAVDFHGVKNTLGVFRDPAAVLVDPQWLSSLPEPEVRSGFAEVIKHALIGDPVLLGMLTNLDQLPTPGGYMALLRRSIAVKVDIVEEDPLEQGRRALLNFGHTIGHALESWALSTDAPLKHGEAIAIGMLAELHAAGLWPQLERAATLIDRFFPRRTVPEQAFPEIWRYMLQDKKNSAGTVRMAVPAEAGAGWRMDALSLEQTAAALRYYNAPASGF